LKEKLLTKRLIIIALRGVLDLLELEQNNFASINNNRLIVLDFDRTINNRKLKQINFELDNVKIETLPKDNMDINTKIDVVRQRTVRKQCRTTSRASVAELLAIASLLSA